MNLRDLRYLINLANTLHVSRAAQLSHVSQPTLSMQIKKLETELGIPLFEREKHRLQLTPAGHQAVHHATRALEQITALKNSMQPFKDPFAGDCHLGLFPTLAPYLLPSLLPTLKKNLSGVRWHLHEAITTDCIAQLKKGSWDAILIASPLHDDTLEQHTVFSEPFVLACAKQHPLAKRQRLSARQIPENELILLNEGHCMRDQSLSYCELIKRNPNTDFRATSLSTLMGMVALNEGITLLPLMAVPYFKKQGIHTLTLSPAPKRTVSLCYRKAYSNPTLMDALMQCLMTSHP